MWPIWYSNLNFWVYYSITHICSWALGLRYNLKFEKEWISYDCFWSIFLKGKDFLLNLRFLLTYLVTPCTLFPGIKFFTKLNRHYPRLLSIQKWGICLVCLHRSTAVNECIDSHYVRYCFVSRKIRFYFQKLCVYLRTFRVLL